MREFTIEITITGVPDGEGVDFSIRPGGDTSDKGSYVASNADNWSGSRDWHVPRSRPLAPTLPGTLEELVGLGEDPLGNVA